MKTAFIKTNCKTKKDPKTPAFGLKQGKMGVKCFKMRVFAGKNKGSVLKHSPISTGIFCRLFYSFYVLACFSVDANGFAFIYKQRNVYRCACFNCCRF